MKSFNKTTISELRKDLENAIKSAEEKHGIAISLGSAKFNDEHLYCMQLNKLSKTHKLFYKN